LENKYFKNPTEVQSSDAQSTSNKFLAKVFSWMFLGLVVTGLLAYVFANNISLIGSLYSQTGGMSGLGYIVMFAPIILVLLMGFGINSLSYVAMVLIFLLYSALTGISFSFIFLVYTDSSIFNVFLITAAMFGVMAFVGYTTSTDLTHIGSLFIMLLVGVIIASLVNMFMRSETFNYIISYICVIIFTGLIAYDIQKIKQIDAQTGINDTATLSKMSILAALTVYLDFFNLFLSLLRIFGKKRNN
jgi:FtsH-binding integral membrane protein